MLRKIANFLPIKNSMSVIAQDKKLSKNPISYFFVLEQSYQLLYNDSIQTKTIHE